MGVLDVFAVDQAAFHHEAAKGMCNKYDRALCRLLQGPVGRQPRSQARHNDLVVIGRTPCRDTGIGVSLLFSMVVDLVFRGAVRERSDIRIVPVCEDSYALFFKGRGEEI